MTVLDFYGAQQPELFALERSAMDRSGRVIAALDEMLPDGRVLDIGAGNGFTAAALSRVGRRIVGLEPSAGMIDRGRALAWLRGDAASLPFAPAVLAGVYATWAYFFPSSLPIEPAVCEAERVLCEGGVLAIANNIGEDEFTALAPRDIAEPVRAFELLGFSLRVVETAFEFETLEDARKLLGFYFGERGRQGARKTLAYRVGIFHKRKE